ncbi:hypothetical protein [Salinimicrobium gaetbulicola]|uniref:Uncharacterized protein n=1 Tax=Salinimicrobium gaetbulicola TaxID=999702 RepID=A0ABW3IFR4_9FLAO
MKLKQSRDELERAKQTVEKIKNSDSLDEYEELWKDFLHYLEKTWIKAERECQGFKNKFMPWQGKFKNLRRKDPLLKYLKNARDADVHSIQEITKKGKSSVTGNFVNPSGGYIEKMVIKNGVIEEYKGDPIIFEFSPGFVKAISFFNNNLLYDIPNYHRGEKVKNPDNPTELAELGIKFYADYLDKIEKEF